MHRKKIVLFSPARQFCLHVVFVTMAAILPVTKDDREKRQKDPGSLVTSLSPWSNHTWTCLYLESFQYLSKNIFFWFYCFALSFPFFFIAEISLGQTSLTHRRLQWRATMDWVPHCWTEDSEPWTQRIGLDIIAR